MKSLKLTVSLPPNVEITFRPLRDEESFDAEA